MNLLPEGLKAGDVVKISKAVPSKGILKKNALEADYATNLLLIDPTFKLCQSFSARCYMEQFEYDISKHILGEVYNPQQTMNDYAHLYNQTEEVLEKPEFASAVGEAFKHLPKTEIAEILYGKHILHGLSTSTGQPP